MTFTGLLTAEEAVACAKAAPDVEWIAHLPDKATDDSWRTVVRATLHEGTWFSDEIKIGPLDRYVQGFAPVPGHWLPMSCAPTDREVLVTGPWNGDRCVWLSRFFGLESDRDGKAIRMWCQPCAIGWVPESAFEGWAPIVMPVKEEP